jgi:Gas vesicle synthesis protein GvpO
VRTREGLGAGTTSRDRLKQRPEPHPEDEHDVQYDEDEYDEDGYDEDEHDDEDEYDEPITAAEAVRAAARHMAGITGKEVSGVISVQHAEDGESWLVGIEVVEDRRIPSTSDMLGLYVVEIDPDGEMLNYRRSRRYKRGTGGNDEVT